jgi:hypothetical protein
MSDDFQEAYKRAREKYDDAAWARLSDQDRAEAVARELRDLDNKDTGDP